MALWRNDQDLPEVTPVPPASSPSASRPYARRSLFGRTHESVRSDIIPHEPSALKTTAALGLITMRFSQLECLLP